MDRDALQVTRHDRKKGHEWNPQFHPYSASRMILVPFIMSLMALTGLTAVSTADRFEQSSGMPVFAAPMQAGLADSKECED
jgi:hypothetical protein